MLDVLGREFLGPVLRLLGFEPGATGIFASQKLSVFALVIGSFAGIGIATATGATSCRASPPAGCRRGWQLAYRPRCRSAHRRVPARRRLVRLQVRRLLVQDTDLRAPVLDWPVWPVQLAIPLGFLSAAGRYFLYAAWPALKPVAAGVPGMKALGLVGSVVGARWRCASRCW